MTSVLCYFFQFVRWLPTMENSVHFSSHCEEAEPRGTRIDAVRSMPVVTKARTRSLAVSFDGRQVDRLVSHVSLNRYFADKVKKDSATLNEQSLGAADRPNASRYYM